MIRSLRISHFAIIDYCQLDFFAGESVVTGETGSGKSLFVDALSFLSGSRSDQRVRPASGEKTRVEGVFLPDPWPEKVLSLLEEAGIKLEEEPLILRRELGDRGSRQWVNDQAVSLQLLRQLGQQLVDIHAQNAQSLLADRKEYLPLLDLYLGKEAEEAKKKIGKRLEKKREVDKEIGALQLSDEEAARRKDLLSYQIQEIEEADLLHFNEEELNQEYKKLVSAQERQEGSLAVLEALTGGSHPIKYGIQTITSQLDDLRGKDPSLRESADLAWQLEAEVESLQDMLEDYYEGVVIDPQRLDEIDQIFSQWQDLKRKYGSTKEEVLAFLEEARGQLDDLNHWQEKKNRLEKERRQLEEEIQKEADLLTARRKEAASRLEKRISQELSEMAIKNLAFSIDFQPRPQIQRDGGDQLDFLLSTNPGQPMESVSAIASGGEMSRFMLAFSIATSEVETIPTLVFDEIDQGISGRTAQLIAQKIHQLTARRQLIVITHLPQIAALGDYHYRVYKEVEEGITHSHIQPLDREGRIQEQARLIGGVNITALTLSSAQEMLDQAEDYRDKERKKGKKEND